MYLDIWNCESLSDKLNGRKCSATPGGLLPPPLPVTSMAPGAPAVEVRPPDIRAGDQFGCSTAMSDSTILVGACGDGWHSGISGAGAAYLLEMQNIEPLVRTVGALTAHDATAEARFGSAVATSQTHVVVGADNHRVAHRHPGAAYVWTMQRDATGRIASATFGRKLLASDANDINFGRSIAMYGNMVAIGASGPDNYPAGFFRPKDNGAVYLFELQSGTLISRLTPADDQGAGIAGCFGFGAAVAFADGLVVVGSPRARAPCTDGTAWGAVWMYETGSGLYRQTAKLSPSDGARSEFGSALAILQQDRTKTRLLVGAPGAVGGAAAGALYIVGPFDSGSISEQTQTGSTRVIPRYTASTGHEVFGAGRLGHALASDLTNGVALIGAPTRFSVKGANSGGASYLRRWDSDGEILGHVIERSLWGEDSESGDQFGASVSVGSNGVALIGAAMHRKNGAATGAAYIYIPTPAPLPPIVPPIPPSPPHPTPPVPSPHRLDGSVGLVAIVAGGLVVGCALIFLANLGITGCRRRATTGPRVKPHLKHGARKRIGMDMEEGEGAAGTSSTLARSFSSSQRCLPTVPEDGDGAISTLSQTRPSRAPADRRDVSLNGRTAPGARARPQSAAVLRGRPGLGVTPTLKKDAACQADFPRRARADGGGVVKRPATAPPRERRLAAPGLQQPHMLAVTPAAALALAPVAATTVAPVPSSEPLDSAALPLAEAAPCNQLWHASIDTPRIPRHTSRPASASRSNAQPLSVSATS